MTKIRMALALDKLIKDVKEEKILWKKNQSYTAEEEESAWNRVATKNSLNGGEAKSIFKVLCKKYRQEALKPASTWQLFNTLKFLDEKCSSIDDEPSKNEVPEESALSPASNNEEETFVELLEVKDEDFSEDDNDDGGDNYDKKNDSKEKVTISIRKDIKSNSGLVNNETNQKQSASVTKASHHHDKDNKSIDKQQNNINKDNSNQNNSNSTINSGHHNNNSNSTSVTGASTATNTDKPISLPLSITIKKEKENNTTPVLLSSIMNSLKRKCPSDNGVQNSTGSNCGNTTSNTSSIYNGTNQKDSDLHHDIPEKRRSIKTSSSSSPGGNVQPKQQKQQQQHHQRLSAQEIIKSINNDVKISPTATESSTTIKNQMTGSTNHQQPTTQSKSSSSSSSSSRNLSNSHKNINNPNNLTKTNQTELINDEHKKFNSFGGYVATTMTRLKPKLAAKLENKILQAIIDINSEMMDHF